MVNPTPSQGPTSMRWGDALHGASDGKAGSRQYIHIHMTQINKKPSASLGGSKDRASLAEISRVSCFHLDRFAKQTEKSQEDYESMKQMVDNTKILAGRWEKKLEGSLYSKIKWAFEWACSFFPGPPIEMPQWLSRICHTAYVDGEIRKFNEKADEFLEEYEAKRSASIAEQLDFLPARVKAVQTDMQSNLDKILQHQIQKNIEDGEGSGILPQFQTDVLDRGYRMAHLGNVKCFSGNQQGALEQLETWIGDGEDRRWNQALQSVLCQTPVDFLWKAIKGGLNGDLTQKVWQKEEKTQLKAELAADKDEQGNALGPLIRFEWVRNDAGKIESAQITYEGSLDIVKTTYGGEELERPLRGAVAGKLTFSLRLDAENLSNPVPIVDGLEVSLKSHLPAKVAPQQRIDQGG